MTLPQDLCLILDFGSPYTQLIARHNPGETVHVQIIRDGKTQTVDVKLGERPEGG